MDTQPDFIDNQGDNTLNQALNFVLGGNTGQEVSESSPSPEEVLIATAFFSVKGFALIAKRLRPVPVVRLLLGADLAFRAANERKRLDETLKTFEQRRIDVGLRRMDDLFHQERDRLPFNTESARDLGELTVAFQAGNVEVRRYTKTFLHAKAYIVTPSEGSGGSSSVIVGSSNLTVSGLTQNLELNLTRYERPLVARAKEWFDELWKESEIYDLAEIFEMALRPHKPWDIFIRVLLQLYGEEVTKDSENDHNLGLTSFQKHGVARALRLIKEMGGVIVADEVGLGKTFIAGEILQIYRSRRQRALLVCPAALRDTTWKRFQNDKELYFECLSFEQLASDSQICSQQKPTINKDYLQRPMEEYQLVIVDEAHNYRNPDAPSRAGILRKFMSGQRRDLVLLTATPVNNSLWDLYHLLRFFLRQDSCLAKRGILSIRECFNDAMREDPSNLSPDILFPVIDATTVKRTRQFVKKHYENDTIPGPDGRPRSIVFPRPIALSVHYDLDDLYPGFFDFLEQVLDPGGDESMLFARYTPQIYLRERDDEEDARAKALTGLLRSGLLKRFESSAHAFGRTVQKMVREHGEFLKALDSGYVVNTAFMKELSADDDAVFKDVLEETEHKVDARLYHIEELRAAVERDHAILQKLVEQAASVSADCDPKLQALADALIKIVKEARHEAICDADERQKRKVLVFSFFEDTVEWIRDYLKEEIDRRPELQPYFGRVEAVSGSDELSEVARLAAVQGFAPISMGAPQGKDNDLYDILISTDVLAEGVNLQQCRHIINFDMPWNPMRLVQRHGRIDRIGSSHDRVFMRTIFPADRLDHLLNLQKRILDKLAMAAASIGVAAPIEGAIQGTQVFAETREEIEKLFDEDASLYERGGTVGAAQTGEEYRQTLRKAIKNGEIPIRQMPWKSGSGMVKGSRRGIFFCAVVGRDSKFERTYLRFIAACDDWQPQLNVNAIQREIGTCLRIIECKPDVPIRFPEVLQKQVYCFWEVAQSDILAAWMHETDPANLQPTIRPLNHRVADFIRANVPPDLAEKDVSRALDILESPWPRREEMLLRKRFEPDDQKGYALSSSLVNYINKTGLEPIKPPDPLPPIAEDDIELLCWIGVEPERRSGL